MTTFQTSADLFRHINLRLENGWYCHLVSFPEPGSVRLQLGTAGELETMWRKYVYGPDLETAIDNAVAFSKRQTVQEYESQHYAHEPSPSPARAMAALGVPGLFDGEAAGDG